MLYMCVICMSGSGAETHAQSCIATRAGATTGFQRAHRSMIARCTFHNP